jgi:hypothetical protein
MTLDAGGTNFRFSGMRGHFGRRATVDQMFKTASKKSF